jgi:hypothetical protein
MAPQLKAMGYACLRVQSSAFSIVPDRAVDRTRYSCGKEFDTRDLFERFSDAAVVRETWIGVALVHGHETHLYRVGTRLRQVERLVSLATTTQKHQRKGGSSAARIQRLRQNKQDHNATYIAEAIVETYYNADANRLDSVEMIVVGGTAQMYEMVHLLLKTSAIAPFLLEPVPSENVNGNPKEQALTVVEQASLLIDRWWFARDETMLAELRRCIAVEPELLEYQPYATLDQSAFRRVFVSHAHLDNTDNDNDNAGAEIDEKKIAIIRRSDFLEQFGGCVAIRY